MIMMLVFLFLDQIYKKEKIKLIKKFTISLNKKEADKLYFEQENINYDNKYWDNRKENIK